MECDRLRKTWKKNAAHDDEGARNKHKLCQITKKKKEAMESAASMSNSSKSVLLYVINGHQSNGWISVVLKDAKDDNISKHDLIRETRSERGK